MAKTNNRAKGPPRRNLSPIEQFIALPDGEKERIAAEYDKEFVPTRPLTASERRQWGKARRKIGRPKKGEGAATVAVSIERGLLKQADALAKRRKVGRSQLFTEGLQAVLSRAKVG